MATIDPSLLNSIFSVTYKYAPDPGNTVSYTRALINIKNINSLEVDTLAYTNIEFGDASGNLFVGDQAGCNSSLVSNCTGFGEQTMDFLAGGSNVEGFGFSALRNTASLTRVVAIGTLAGDSNSNVADTVIIGSLAARNLSSASSNVIIGSGAGTSLTGGSNNIFIGAGVNPVSGVGNNVINIANTISGTVGGTISMPNVYANGVRVLGGGGNPGFIVQDASSSQQFRFQWLPDPNARSIIQTNAPLYFNQVGTAQGNTYLTISTASTDGDVFRIGGTVEARTVSAYSTTSASSLIAWNTSGGSGSGSGQTYAMYLADTNVTLFGVGKANQMIAYAYPSATRPSVRGSGVIAYRVLLSDQSIPGLSTGDVYVDYTLAAQTILADNLSIANNLSVGQNVSVGGTISAAKFVGSAVLTQTTILSTIMGFNQQTANGNGYASSTFVYWDVSNLSYTGSTINASYLTTASPYLSQFSTFVLTKSGLYSITLTRTDTYNQPRAIVMTSGSDLIAIERSITGPGAGGGQGNQTVTAWLPAGGQFRVVGDGGTATIPTNGAGVCGIRVRLLHETT